MFKFISVIYTPVEVEGKEHNVIAFYFEDQNKRICEALLEIPEGCDSKLFFAKLKNLEQSLKKYD